MNYSYLHRLSKLPKQTADMKPLMTESKEQSDEQIV